MPARGCASCSSTRVPILWSGGTRAPDAAIRALSPRRRLIVFLRYFADLPYAQIAEICHVSEGTVAATLSQAHEQLADALNMEEVKGR